MNLSTLQVSALSKLLASNPNEAKAILKLTSIDVLSSLTDGKYTIKLGDKTLTAQSQKPLEQGSSYWVQYNTKEQQPKLTNITKIPLIFDKLKNMQTTLTPREFQTLLETKNPLKSLSNTLLEKLSTATTKEEFTNLSNLLLSLHNHVMSIPMRYENYFALLQFKKRYNTKTKKKQIDFYAAFELLGPISGVISFEESTTEVHLNVAFEKTKYFLEDDMKNFSHAIHISLQENIQPLYELTNNALLDISI
jgi:hypothetical protein